MAVFNQISSGGIVLAGCPVVSYSKTFVTKFAPCEIAFSRKHALKGKLEKIVIKKHKVSNMLKTGGIFHIMYVDTWNGLWNEDELVSHQEAINLATIYYQRLLFLAGKIRKC
jgi:hypothetical protein